MAHTLEITISLQCFWPLPRLQGHYSALQHYEVAPGSVISPGSKLYHAKNGEATD